MTTYATYDGISWEDTPPATRDRLALSSFDAIELGARGRSPDRADALLAYACPTDRPSIVADRDGERGAFEEGRGGLRDALDDRGFRFADGATELSLLLPETSTPCSDAERIEGVRTAPPSVVIEDARRADPRRFNHQLRKEDAVATFLELYAPPSAIAALQSGFADNRPEVAVLDRLRRSTEN